MSHPEVIRSKKVKIFRQSKYSCSRVFLFIDILLKEQQYTLMCFCKFSCNLVFATSDIINVIFPTTGRLNSEQAGCGKAQCGFIQCLVSWAQFGGGHGDVSLHLFRWGGHNMPCPHHFFSLGFILGEVSKMKVMFVTFCVKSFSCQMVGHTYPSLC